ncbi:major tail protein [Spiroplasma endosymbiont of Poecilobothrus nobilitatus]|uniref:major tail protein n=1 Tax=Spiroplasma endosymbiont of Poecilobothrus nobilitatus TaxID=1209220 RepID=UPI00313DEA53
MNKDNLIEFGLSNVHYAIIKTIDNKISYETPKAIKGATSLALNIAENTTTIYADNIPYYIAHSNQGYTGTLTIIKPSDTFLEEIFGLIKDKNNIRFEKSNIQPKEMALGFEIDGDTEKRRIWLYRVNLKRSNETHNTKNENVEADTYSFEFNALPRAEDNIIKSYISENTNKNIFNSWFNEVYKENSEIHSEIIKINISKINKIEKPIIHVTNAASTTPEELKSQFKDVVLKAVKTVNSSLTESDFDYFIESKGEDWPINITNDKTVAVQIEGKNNATGQTNTIDVKIKNS